MKIKEIALAVLAISALGAASSVSLYYMTMWRQNQKNARYYYRAFEEVASQLINGGDKDTFIAQRNYLINKMITEGYKFSEAHIVARDAENDIGDALGFSFELKKIR